MLTNLGPYSSGLKVCCSCSEWNWDQALSHNSCLLLVEQTCPFFLGVVKKLSIHQGQKLKGCFYKRPSKILYTNRGALGPRGQGACGVWGMESGAQIQLWHLRKLRLWSRQQMAPVTQPSAISALCLFLNFSFIQIWNCKNFFFFVFLPFLGPHQRHMEVPS